MVDTIQALFIDPDAKKVETVQLREKLGDIDLEECYDLLECDLVEFVYFGNREILIVDEEGLVRNKEVFKLEGVGQQYFAGKALVVQEKGEVCTGLKDEQITQISSKVSFPEIEEEE